MKKIFITLLTALLLVTTVSAEDMIFLDSGEEYYGETEVTYQEYSSFYVSIPTQISDMMDGEVSVTLDHIEEGYHVGVYATNLDDYGYVPISSGNDSGKMRLYGGDRTVGGDGFIGRLNQANNGDVGVIKLSVSPASDHKLKPGIYTGSISFRICCEVDS